jgi:hypothetical protein
VIFINFGRELINLSQVYQIDLKDTDGGVKIAFFYHLANTTAGGFKISGVFRTVDGAVAALTSLGIDVRSINGAVEDEYYDASQVPTERINTRLEPTRHRK